MIALNKKSIKEIPVGAKIHLVGKDIDIIGKVTRNDELGLSIFSTNKTIVGIPVVNFLNQYDFELL